jgi:FtsZ-binding cell division protein ZapB
MSVVGQLQEREDRPALVSFEKVPVEDKEASLKAGHYVAKDVEYANTLVSTKDITTQKVSVWIANMEANVRAGRYKPEWRDQNLKKLEAWRNGQEIPLNGAAILGWPVISPAQQRTLIGLNVLTVEDLAAINDDKARQIGMGSLDLKNKAKAWLAQRSDKGPLTIEIAALKSENNTLKASLQSLQAQVDKLVAQAQQPSPAPAVRVRNSDPISADDILPDGGTDDSIE